MHAQGLGHLDLKPANVIMRQPPGETDLVSEAPQASPVLVDFGLAGRKIRPGCASPHYGAPEIWDPGMYGSTEPMAADVYGFSVPKMLGVTNDPLIIGGGPTATHPEPSKPPSMRFESGFGGPARATEPGQRFSVSSRRSPWRWDLRQSGSGPARHDPPACASGESPCLRAMDGSPEN